jgi:hypothetical protein
MTDKIFLIISPFIICLLFLSFAFSQIQLYGNGHLEYSLDTENDKNYFEDWTDVYLAYDKWRLGARYEFHLPPHPFSRDSIGQGLSQRFLEYRKGDLYLLIGNSYSIFGKGVVLRLFDNRALRWDSNLDGIQITYFHSKFDLQLIGGRPRDRRGQRREPLQGGSFSLSPTGKFSFGGNYLTTDLNSKGRSNWGSAFFEVNVEWGSFYGEGAFSDFPKTDPKGKALYAMGNVFYGPFTALVEYKNYDQFDLTERIAVNNIPSEMTYNNPPAVTREHLYTLMNRHQLNQNADDEVGYLVEITYSHHDAVVVTFSHSHTQNQDNDVLYGEYYGQIDWDPNYNFDLVGGIGQQEDLEAKYLNFVGSVKWGFMSYQSLRFIFEHQHATINFNDRQFFNQALTISYDRAPNYSISFIGERSTDQEASRDFWLAGQIDINFLENFDFTIFAGRRREGKICIGGICINRPLFEGIEFRLINRF